MLTQCTQCGQEMRPRRSTLDEYPNTQIIGSMGLCGPCYSADFRARRAATAELELPATMAALSGFLHQRRLRIERNNRSARA